MIHSFTIIHHSMCAPRASGHLGLHAMYHVPQVQLGPNLVILIPLLDLMERWTFFGDAGGKKKKFDFDSVPRIKGQRGHIEHCVRSTVRKRSRRLRRRQLHFQRRLTEGGTSRAEGGRAGLTTCDQSGLRRRKTNGRIQFHIFSHIFSYFHIFSSSTKLKWLI